MKYCWEHKELSFNRRRQEAWVLWHTQARSVAGEHPANEINFTAISFAGSRRANTKQLRGDAGRPGHRHSGEWSTGAGLLATTSTTTASCCLCMLGPKIYPCLALSMKSGNYSQRGNICQLYNKSLHLNILFQKLHASPLSPHILGSSVTKKLIYIFKAFLWH